MTKAVQKITLSPSRDIPFNKLVLGLDSVSLGGIERIDISRGAGTSLIAPEALAGSVNIVTRRPIRDEFMAVQQFGSYGQMNTDLFGAKAFTGGAVTANFNHNQHDTVDADGNETGMFEVPAGGRRYRALELLVKQKRMSKTQAVPCVVREGGIAEDD